MREEDWNGDSLDKYQRAERLCAEVTSLLDGQTIAEIHAKRPRIAADMGRAVRELFTTAASRTGMSHDFSAMSGSKENVLESVNYLKDGLRAAGLKDNEFEVTMSETGREWRMDAPTVIPLPPKNFETRMKESQDQKPKKPRHELASEARKDQLEFAERLNKITCAMYDEATKKPSWSRWTQRPEVTTRGGNVQIG